MGEVKNTTMNIPVELYLRLQPLRRIADDAIARREPAYKVVERLLDFFEKENEDDNNKETGRSQNKR